MQAVEAVPYIYYYSLYDFWAFFEFVNKDPSR